MNTPHQRRVTKPRTLNSWKVCLGEEQHTEKSANGGDDLSINNESSKDKSFDGISLDELHQIESNVDCIEESDGDKKRVNLSPSAPPSKRRKKNGSEKEQSIEDRGEKEEQTMVEEEEDGEDDSPKKGKRRKGVGWWCRLPPPHHPSVVTSTRTLCG